MQRKISLIGAGNIGGTMASMVSGWGFVDVVLYDINQGIAKGKALDIMQMNTALGLNSSVVGTAKISDIKGSDVIIITAGLARSPGMSRDDLLLSNATVIRSIALDVKQHSPGAFCIVVTNPLDAMVFEFQKHSGLLKNMVVGMAGTLDSARFKYFLSEELCVSAQNIDTMVLGGHGDSMVPVKSCTSVGGIGIEDMIKMGLCSQEVFDSVVAKTRNGGAEIVALLQKGSAFYAPAACTIEIVKSFLLNERRLIPVCTFLNGKYGTSDIAFGVPAVIGSAGVESIVEASLSNNEEKMLQESISSVRQLVAKLPQS